MVQVERGDEWTFAIVPAPERVAERLSERTGLTFRVQPFGRGEVVVTDGDQGLRWAPVGGNAVRVEVHERITPYLSWQADAVLTELGGQADRPLEVPPIALRPWSELGAWSRARYGAHGWVVQVALLVLLAAPVVVLAGLLLAGRGRKPDDDA